MECNEVRELLSAYIDGEVTAEEKKQVERHLQSCAGCREAYGQYVDMGAVLKMLPFLEPDTPLKEKVQDKIKYKRNILNRLIWSEWVAVAVAVVLICALGLTAISLSGLTLFSKGEASKVSQEKEADAGVMGGALEFGVTGELNTGVVPQKRPAKYTPATSGGETTSPERKIVKTASGKLTVKNLEDFNRWLAQELGRVNGYVKFSREEKEIRELTLMIPADKLKSFVDDLKKQGELESYSENAEDVTKAYRDMEIRIKNLESEIKAVRALLIKAQKVEEILAVRAELNRLTEELEITKASFEDLKQNVAYSTLNLKVVKEKAAQIGEDSLFKNLGKKIKEQFINAFNNFFTVLIKLFFLLIYLLPYLILLLLIIFFVYRFKKKKSGT
ncbi:DUF4349 domain-containing protein [Carboxydothermus ferrireducens]|uniref:Anti-sigma-W factor RsiW n=1 Tax=Carboxydothermus ferrireducens DSM 11255 TaxID=1119529 RepID=A0ABX2REV6_9THEO|nr:DUF4349 domain-containing protein [Carboxydothermus ferrireducens]NYE58407.1 putative nucleic acid-binding Zn-ribbon protein [Carboxydothermus ferrireducens DSM 11255]